MRRTPILTVIALAALALTSCSSGGTDPAAELPGVSPSTRPPLQTTTPGPIGPSAGDRRTSEPLGRPRRRPHEAGRDGTPRSCPPKR
jgi:hypothetical protein